MRSFVQRAGEEEEQESSFVSTTNLTVSFLFIVMLLMSFFATRYADETPDPLEEYLQKVADTRKNVLQALHDGIEADLEDLEVVINEQNGALQLQGDGLFETGKWDLDERAGEIVRSIAENLNQLLPCYTGGRLAKWQSDCNEHFAIIESVQIEGHTDNVGDDEYNLNLSTNRANSTFLEMIKHQEDLISHQNMRDFPVLSVAGYGEMRPVATNESDEGRSQNRRIDLRIIMFTPSGQEGVEEVITKLI